MHLPYGLCLLYYTTSKGCPSGVATKPIGNSWLYDLHVTTLVLGDAGGSSPDANVGGGTPLTLFIVIMMQALHMSIPVPTELLTYRRDSLLH